MISSADQLLDYLRQGGDVFQSRVLSDDSSNPWVIEGGLRVPETFVRDLRRRGQIAVSEGVLWRYLRPLENTTSCRRTECGSESY